MAQITIVLLLSDFNVNVQNPDQASMTIGQAVIDCVNEKSKINN